MASFPHINDATGQQYNDGRTRAFQATGGYLLPVPGLQKLEAVRIGTVEIPLKAPRPFHMQVKGQQPGPVMQEVDMVMHQITADFGSVLLRSVYSNDGIWQDGATIFVTGEWDGDVASGQNAEKRVAYEAMTKGDLVLLATNRQITVKQTWSKAKVIDALLHDDAKPDGQE